jgi:hypothetical protein
MHRPAGVENAPTPSDHNRFEAVQRVSEERPLLRVRADICMAELPVGIYPDALSASRIKRLQPTNLDSGRSTLSRGG